MASLPPPTSTVLHRDGLLQRDGLLHRHLYCTRTRSQTRKKQSRKQRVDKRGCDQGGVSQLSTVEEDKVSRFREWCEVVGISLHPELYIGSVGSCSGIGVIATSDIDIGDELAVIPRTALLTASSGVGGPVMLADTQLLTNVGEEPSWVPLLLSIIAELAQEESSQWKPYLDVISDNNNSGPPLLWSEEDRHRLLSGMAVDALVNNDMKLINIDYQSIAEPFMLRHPDVYPDSVVARQIYEQVTALVMAYSFTDTVDHDMRNALSAHGRTSMVPFVDLLNHHHQHHAELTFHTDCLRLVAVRQIHRGEEIMNTYGELPNCTLLHMYGFTLDGNPHDTVTVGRDALKTVYMSEEKTRSVRRRRWRMLLGQGLLQPADYEIRCNGDVDADLLVVVRLLLAPVEMVRVMYDELCLHERQEHQTTHIPLSLDQLSATERTFLRRLAVWCVHHLPADLTSCQAVTGLRWQLLGSREWAALQLCISYHHCYNKLINNIDNV